MADTKISDLTAVTTVLSTDEYVLARSGATNKITGADLITAFGGTSGITVISDQTLGADTQTISFTSIPNTYTNLRVMVMLRTDSGNNDINVRFNNDSGSNYDWEQVLIINSGLIDGAAAGSQAVQGVAQTSITAGYCAASTYPTDEFGMYEFLVPFYLAGSLKKLIGQGHVRAAASSGNIYRIDGAGTWRSTAAITRLDVIAVSKFKAASRAILYGTV